MAKPYNRAVKSNTSSSSLSRLAGGFAKEVGDETDIKDIITFLEAPWGMNLNADTQPLLPGQKFILKLYYKIPLETKIKTIIIRDKFNERDLYSFTEQEYLEYLYKSGRCNIKYIDDKPRNELVLIIGRRGSKCGKFDSPITTTSGTITYGELLSRLQNKEKIGIFTYDPKTWRKFVTYDILAEDNGEKEVIRLTTKFGRTEETTTNHPYLVWRDNWLEPQWVELRDIKIGDKLAVAKSQELFGNTSIGEGESKLLGYLLGDGGITSGIKFTNMDKVLIDDIQKLLGTYFPGHTIKEITGSKFGFSIVSDDKRGISKKNKVLNWIRDIGEYGKKATKKRIPNCIKIAPKEEVAFFLNRLYSCDGFVSIDKPRHQHKIPKTSIDITLSSKNFILDIQRELLKFGIISNWCYAKVKLKDKEFDSWKLSIAQKDSIIKFEKEINIFQKEEKVHLAVQHSIEKSPSKNELAFFPRGAWNRISKSKKEKSLKNCDIYGESSYGNTRLRSCYKLSKDKAVTYAKNTDDSLLLNLAESDIYWDEVKDLESIGLHKTVVLEVKGTNIIGNDIISHNSTVASWIAAYETYKLLKISHPQKHYGLLPDAEIHLTTIATSEDQANMLFRTILGHFSHSNYFHRFLSRPTADKICIRSRRDLEKYGDEGKTSIVVKSAPCSARAMRGAGNILAIMDEQAHFVDENAESNKSDKAVYEAITPSVATFKGDGKIINISSPLNKSGMLWDLYNKALEGAENILMIQAPTWEINHTIDPTFLKGRYQSNPIAYDCEFGGNFSERVSSWLPEEYLRRVIVPDLRPKKNGVTRVPYFMGLDIGFKGDGTSLAICHIETVKDEEGNNINKIELDYVETRCAGVHPYENYEILDFELLADWIKEICNRYHVVKGLIDQHNGVMVSQNLAKRGLHQFELVYHTRQFNSDLYQNFMMLCIDKKLRLYNDKPDEYNDGPLVEELLRLQVTQYSKNVIAVEAPKQKGHHDDMSDALVRCVWLATEALKNGAGGSGNSLHQNSYGYVRDANHYQMMKSRHHNITDNRRKTRNLRRNAWTNKYG